MNQINRLKKKKKPDAYIRMKLYRCILWTFNLGGITKQVQFLKKFHTENILKRWKLLHEKISVA